MVLLCFTLMSSLLRPGSSASSLTAMSVMTTWTWAPCGRSVSGCACAYLRPGASRQKVLRRVIIPLGLFMRIPPTFEVTVLRIAASHFLNLTPYYPGYSDSQLVYVTGVTVPEAKATESADRNIASIFQRNAALS